MLPTGISDVMAVSITRSAVMIAITDPAPQAIAQVDTANAPGIFFARRAEIFPAATIIAASISPPVQRGPRNRIASTEPTAMICTSPRTSAIDVSFSRWICRVRASITTRNAAAAAIAACTSPTIAW